MTRPILDAVYVVRPGEANPWLRYSLRSLSNLPHRHVWIVGYRPSWVADTVGYIPTQQGSSKYANVTGNLETAVAFDQLADRFVLMNDDFFILHPLARIPVLHRGPLDDTMPLFSRNQPAARALAALMRDGGRAGTLWNYELHMPMEFERARLAEVLDLARRPGGDVLPRFTRTRYGNWWQVGGAQIPDCKVRRPHGQEFARDGLFLSTSPHSWGGEAGAFIRDRFPARCGYERPGPDRRRLSPVQPRASAPKAAAR